ncbi:MAG: hypothetical protein HY609_03960 [Deltaproteobacteria bacterium]|nr:hypothetical protein [Deltaproteobacteria bacterium]MBI4224063.1 hypothetical protein [Deltaproteobacteria bacterium]
MNQKMNWKEMIKTYPDEWVALIDYEQRDPVEIEGIVVAHGPDRKTFHETVGQLLPQYGDMAIRYTGELVKNPELPLLWQISHTD